MNDPKKISESALPLQAQMPSNQHSEKGSEEPSAPGRNLAAGKVVRSKKIGARKMYIPATIVKMKGRPKRRKGWLLRFLL